ncbi:uncharacterized protein EKO05_0010178 [Ascochyta rabiei]|uniref:Uncharacterized protein n=1 Tax=Didymella rabiei TaxID=5454 RepID=A0A162WPE3_DIDRA|nr:uncharacterized protein EKO05_0010178 [Ascochyta rabiei]KZM19143.1 hypothetical protein ST47_g9722 [Ascochyta rabiei]UPX19929.1 hypothetical protein EKO05_0010178 [Ascochyta rabiei]
MKYFSRSLYSRLTPNLVRNGPFRSDEEETKEFIDKRRDDDNQVSFAPRWLVILSILNALALFISCTLFGAWFYNYHLVNNANYRRTSAYSPVMDQFDLSSTLKKINGSFYNRKGDISVARQQPNPSADATWDEWELTRVYPVSQSELIKMNVDPSTVAKLEDSTWGLGDDAYAAIFDVYHHVHCLNSLRHIAYGDYYNKSQARAHTVKQREIHINHCIDILLQGIQCNANLDLIPLHWVETQEYPFPDMSINKMCVNFDGLTEWRREHTIDMDKYVEVMKMPMGEKPGIKQLPAADQYYEYWGYDNPNHKPVDEGGHGLPMDVDSNL